ncbi:MAG TPA: HEXXH motif-containing putative peptide modification protein [Kofleriaceae bacterium]|jgi:hypothetical protein|nr:HEXXH motif-containing putative peptide modification protein [Kofleriaceae bacterium]
MFYAFGEQYAYNLLFTVAKKFFTRTVDELELEDFQRAYQGWVASVQAHLPATRELGVELVCDAEREAQLIAPLLEPSPLDDRPHYRDLSQFNRVQADREQIARETSHLAALLEQFRAKDTSFWEVFSIYVNHVVCASSKFTSGGTSSQALGVIYLANPLTRSADSLYELFVHESTHLMMFVDERRARHYRDYRALAQPENFSVSAVYEKQRPLDKTLHSIAVATEVLLHREHVIGHASDSSVHPPTPKLTASTLRACDALLELQARRQLLAPRGVQIIETCAAKLHDINVDAPIAVAV